MLHEEMKYFSCPAFQTLFVASNELFLTDFTPQVTDQLGFLPGLDLEQHSGLKLKGCKSLRINKKARLFLI